MNYPASRWPRETAASLSHSVLTDTEGSRQQLLVYASPEQSRIVRILLQNAEFGE
jgi:hypothetical protein